jgi:predicted Zn-dependent peptidase
MTTSAGHPAIFHTHRLNNGLQIVGQVMPDFASVALSYSVQVGARDEHDASLAGVSHFLEHMVFKGTQTLDGHQIKQEFNKIGAELNAATSVESTVYFARVVGEYVDRALALLSDMMVPRLDEGDFMTEKEVIINEIARSEDQPRGRASRSMMQTYFVDHPLGHIVLGSRESIRDMQIEQMREYWRRRYVTNNMILSVAGNFDWEHLMDLAGQHCSIWQAGDSERLLTPYEPPRPINNVMVDKKLQQQIMFLTMPMVAEKDPDRYAAALGSSILGQPGGSRLFWKIRHKGLAESASSSIRTMKGAGILLLAASTAPQQASHVLNLLRAELITLLDDGITEEELRRAKDKWISGIVLASESTFNRMRSIAYDWEIEGRLVDIEERIERVERVTTDDVMRVLRRFPLREKQVLTALGPLNEEELLVA